MASEAGPSLKVLGPLSCNVSVASSPQLNFDSFHVYRSILIKCHLVYSTVYLAVHNINKNQ